MVNDYVKQNFIDFIAKSKLKYTEISEMFNIPKSTLNEYVKHDKHSEIEDKLVKMMSKLTRYTYSENELREYYVEFDEQECKSIAERDEALFDSAIKSIMVIFAFLPVNTCNDVQSFNLKKAFYNIDSFELALDNITLDTLEKRIDNTIYYLEMATEEDLANDEKALAYCDLISYYCYKYMMTLLNYYNTLECDFKTKNLCKYYMNVRNIIDHKKVLIIREEWKKKYDDIITELLKGIRKINDLYGNDYYNFFSITRKILLLDENNQYYQEIADVYYDLITDQYESGNQFAIESMKNIAEIYNCCSQCE